MICTNTIKIPLCISSDSRHKERLFLPSVTGFNLEIRVSIATGACALSSSSPFVPRFRVIES